MKKVKRFLYILTAGVVLVACKKDPNVEMVSLNKVGDEHYFGEKVLMWASTEGEKKGITYEWKATGGSFEGFRTQNLFENVWIAPTEAGQFEVTATAKNGKNTSTRKTVLNVTRYFFEHFQSPNIFAGQGWPGWAQSNTTTTLQNTDDKLNSRIEVLPSRVNTSNTDANIRKTLNLADLKIPFSIRTKMGFRNYFKPNAPFTIHLFFRQPKDNVDRPFIREIRWEIFPSTTTTTTNNYQIRYEVYTPNRTTSSNFSTNTGVYPSALPLINPVTGRNNTLFNFTSGVAKNLTFSIDADNVFIAHVDGVEWFRSNGIKDWLAAAKAQWPDFEDPVAREFRISLPGRASTSLPNSNIFVNSVYINNDGVILSNPL